MTAINSFSYTRTSISDFSLDDHFAYQDANEIKDNINHDWEVFKKAHGSDGEHKSWITANAVSPVHSDSDVFIASGDFADAFTARRRIRINCGVDGYKYRTVQSATVSGDDTIVSFEPDVDNEITTNLESVELSIIKDLLSLPQWESVYFDYDASNLLNASGDLTGPVLNLDYNPSRALVKGLGDAGLDYRLMKLNSLGDLLEVQGSDVVFYSGFSSTIKASTSISGPTNAQKIGGMVMDGKGGDLYLVQEDVSGSPDKIYHCSGTDCDFSDSSSYDTGYMYFRGMAFDGSNLIVAHSGGGANSQIYRHSGTDITTYSTFTLGNYEPRGIMVDNNGDLVSVYSTGSYPDYEWDFVTHSGISGTVKSSTSFLSSHSTINDATFDGMRMAVKVYDADGPILIYDDIRSSALVTSWTGGATSRNALSYEPKDGAYELCKSLVPGVPAGDLVIEGARTRLDISGGDGAVCRSVELSLAR